MKINTYQDLKSLLKGSFEKKDFNFDWKNWQKFVFVQKDKEGYRIKTFKVVTGWKFLPENRKKFNSLKNTKKEVYSEIANYLESEWFKWKDKSDIILEEKEINLDLKEIPTISNSEHIKMFKAKDLEHQRYFYHNRSYFSDKTDKELNQMLLDFENIKKIKNINKYNWRYHVIKINIDWELLERKNKIIWNDIIKGKIKINKDWIKSKDLIENIEWLESKIKEWLKQSLKEWKWIDYSLTYYNQMKVFIENNNDLINQIDINKILKEKEEKGFLTEIEKDNFINEIFENFSFIDKLKYKEKIEDLFNYKKFERKEKYLYKLRFDEYWHNNWHQSLIANTIKEAEEKFKTINNKTTWFAIVAILYKCRLNSNWVETFWEIEEYFYTKDWIKKQIDLESEYLKYKLTTKESIEKYIKQIKEKEKEKELIFWKFARGDFLRTWIKEIDYYKMLLNWETSEKLYNKLIIGISKNKTINWHIVKIFN